MMHVTKGCLAALLATANVLLMAIPFFSAVLLKLCIPMESSQCFFTRMVTALAKRYNQNNALIFRAMSHIDWQISGTENLSSKGSYLVTANHQSWADIPVLQHVMEQHIPLLKFFLKKELLWVPVLGAAWWALDFPFMKRYSREYLEQHPEKRGEDLAETRRMCERFKHAPVSVMSFLEGTRFSTEKKMAQQSPYDHLLRPKTGGAVLAINCMEGSIKTVVDVTIDYQIQEDVTLWKLFSGQIRRIIIDIKLYELPEHLLSGNYEADTVYRKEIQAWFHSIWCRKDAWLSQVRQSATRTGQAVLHSGQG